MASSFSALNPVSREIVILSFQLQEFLETKHSYTDDLLDEERRQILNHIITSNFRPPSVSRGVSSARDDRARQRSTEPRSWPASWAVNKSSLRASLKTFDKGTEALRRLRDPPSTGKTPSPLSTPSWSTISNPSGSTGQTTRQTSAEETIYPQPIGPRNRMNLNDPAIQAVITAAATAAVAQYIRDNPPQQGPAGPPKDRGPPGTDATGNNNGSLT